jgi:hypothetical protein
LTICPKNKKKKPKKKTIRHQVEPTLSVGNYHIPFLTTPLFSCSPFHAKQKPPAVQNFSLSNLLSTLPNGTGNDLSGLAGRATPSLLLTFWSPSRRNLEDLSKPLAGCASS